MNEFIIKADRKALQVTTAIVRGWVRRRDFEKHKIDFLIQLEWWGLYFGVLTALIVPTAIYLSLSKPGMALFHFCAWSALCGFQYAHIKMLNESMKPFYDWIFSQRENAGFQKMHKEVLEEQFENSRRDRLILTVTIVTLTWLAFFLLTISLASLETKAAHYSTWLYLLILHTLLNPFGQYVRYVDETDPPGSKKTVLERLTELMQRLWEVLVPTPAARQL